MRFKVKATGVILEPNSLMAEEQMLKHSESYELINESVTEVKVADEVEAKAEKKAPVTKKKSK